MNEYQPHDYSGVVDSGLRRVMEEFEPFLASVPYPFRYRWLLPSEPYYYIQRTFGTTLKESTFLITEARKEGIIRVEPIQDAGRPTAHRILGSLSPSQRGRPTPLLFIDLDNLRALRNLIWGYNQAGDNMDGVHTLAPAVETARGG